MSSADGGTDFVVLITDAQPRLYSYILSLVPRLADAKDVLQNANLELWAKRDQYRPDQPFWPWARRFAELQVLAYLKRHGRDRHCFDVELVELLTAEEPTDARLEERKEIALEKCLAELGNRMADMLKMRYGQSLSCPQIAQKVGRSAGAVRDALYRARLTMARCMRRRLAKEAD